MIKSKPWPSHETREELLAWKEATRSQRNAGENYFLEEPGNPFSAPDASHINRYMMAKDTIEKTNSTDVLDAAMGCGYGGLIMQPRRYTGIDIRPYNVEYAAKFSFPWLTGEAYMMEHDLKKGFPGADNSYDVVVSFETLEHVPQKDGKRLTKDAGRVLRPGGLWLVSNPLPGAKHELVSDYHEYEREFTEFALDVRQADLLIDEAYIQTVQEPTLVRIENLARPPRERSDKEKIFYVVLVCRKPK